MIQRFTLTCPMKFRDVNSSYSLYLVANHVLVDALVKNLTTLFCADVRAFYFSLIPFDVCSKIVINIDTNQKLRTQQLNIIRCTTEYYRITLKGVNVFTSERSVFMKATFEYQCLKHLHYQVHVKSYNKYVPYQQFKSNMSTFKISICIKKSKLRDELYYKVSRLKTISETKHAANNNSYQRYMYLQWQSKQYATNTPW